MRVRTDFPRRVREIENVWISLADGTRLGARIWLPEDAEADPVPGILEAIPYRKSDWTAPRDAVRHPYFAGHGYACVRLDLRGTGDSDGILEDEYLRQEQEDIEEAIAWIAAQPWCTGAVGMFGISWGGFNGLQVAARRPPALKAVVSACSTDDRYADDVHYMGGCVLGDQMLPWSSTMLVWNACPPDPSVVGQRWRELWLERIKRTPPFAEAWLAHQRRDAYWKHGSVCEDYAAIECPVYLVGGWADGYQNAVFRFLEGAPGARKGLVGPWAHAFPDEGVPGPKIGFLQEALRWWDRWLKGVETGIDHEPMLRAWIQEPAPPRVEYDERPGRWVAEEAWPSASVGERSWYLGDGILAQEPGPMVALELLGAQTCGHDAGPWGAYGEALDLPGDQRADDGLSLTFDSAPLEERIEILGFPEARLALAVDRPLAAIAVRLCSVAPTGASTLVTRGVLNLTHRESDEHPEPLEPGRRYEVSIRLRAVGQAFDPGHRLRLAVSPTYWPLVWPSPEPVTLTVFAGESSSLVLPIRSPRPEDEALAPFDEPELAPELAVEELSAAAVRRTIERDIGTGETVLTYAYGNGHRRLPNGTEIEDEYQEIFRIVEEKPLSARVETAARVQLGRGAWRTRIEAKSSLSSDAEAFHLENRVDAYESGQLVASKAWARSIPRDLV